MVRDATDIFARMYGDVCAFGSIRRVSDPASPAQGELLDYTPLRSYLLSDTRFNVPAQRRTDIRWAMANVLHFFSDTEEAEMLPKYNPHAARFLTGDLWVGAYGKLAMWQIRACLDLLSSDLYSRRAVVTMGNLAECDINRPSCINLMHFLVSDGLLNLIVYQRSLNLAAVMPYDCILLTNILRFVAKMLGAECGSLLWNVGSLHMPVGYRPNHTGDSDRTCILPPSVLESPKECMRWLRYPEEVLEPWRSILLDGASS